MRRKGSKVDYFGTIIPSGICAKAVCCRMSQRQHGVGCQNHVTVTALPNCGKFHSRIFIPLKPFKILRMFIYPAIKYYKELWRVEDRARSESLKRVRAEAAIKTARERIRRIRRNPPWKQKIMSQKLNISTQSSHASSGTIYT